MKYSTQLMFLLSINLFATSSDKVNDENFIQFIDTSEINYLDEDEPSDNTDLFLDTDYPVLTELVIVKIHSELE